MSIRPSNIIVDGERWVAVLRDGTGQWLYAIPGYCVLMSAEHLARKGGRYEDGEQ